MSNADERKMIFKNARLVVAPVWQAEAASATAISKRSGRQRKNVFGANNKKSILGERPSPLKICSGEAQNGAATAFQIFYEQITYLL